jgi:hypothetical protein
VYPKVVLGLDREESLYPDKVRRVQKRVLQGDGKVSNHSSGKREEAAGAAIKFTTSKS